jgi:aminoglycoside phosphotransferase (APT) family kinase protein
MQDDPVSDEVRGALERMNLLSRGASFSMTPLTGGVSSRILLIEAEGRRFCFKQALPKLNVRADWYAPTERNRAEVAWIETANAILPGIAPHILAADEAIHAFAMTYLPLEDYSIWKSDLLGGRACGKTAHAAGHALAALHGATTGNIAIAQSFDNAGQFHALRVDPYILAAARQHPNIATRLETLAAHLDSARIALVHGDFSPKNILVGGPQGLIVLDAECATLGDPAFDVAFCLTHLMLKQRSNCANRLQATEAFHHFLTSYQKGLTWESWDGFERRLVNLLPALLLARIDGKSPVDYLDGAARDVVRTFAVNCITRASQSISALTRAWENTSE